MPRILRSCVVCFGNEDGADLCFIEGTRVSFAHKSYLDELVKAGK